MPCNLPYPTWIEFVYFHLSRKYIGLICSTSTFSDNVILFFEIENFILFKINVIRDIEIYTNLDLSVKPQNNVLF